MLARGLRNNNPGNIRLSTTQWQGQVPGEDTAFVTFETMAHGIRALVVLLQTYFNKHRLDTVRKIISRWAPPSENDTDAYIAAVCKPGNLDPNQILTPDRLTLEYLARQIAKHENGKDADKISQQDWIAGMDMVFGNAVAGDIPTLTDVIKPAPVVVKEKKMPFPISIALAAADALLPLVIDLFRGHGSKTAMRNADIIEKAGPSMVEIAKVVSGEQGVAEAVTAVLDSPQKSAEFRAAVERDLDKLVGMIERVVRMEDESRDRAAERAAKAPVDFAPALIKNQFYLLGSLSAATVVAFMLSIYFKADNEILVGLMVLFTGLVNSTATKWGTMIEYRFGSSAGSQAKDEIIASSRK